MSPEVAEAALNLRSEPTGTSMRDISSILVPTDFSPVANHALEYALRLADALGADVDLLHVIPRTLDNQPEFEDSLAGSLRARAGEQLARVAWVALEGVAGDLKHPPLLDTFVRSGDLPACVHRHVVHHGTRLIVMGTRGRQDAWDELFGTHAARVTTVLPCPVLIVPPDAHYRPVAALCFATDLSDPAALHAGKVLRAFRAYKPRIHFLHIRTRKVKKTDYDIELLREIFDRPQLGQHAVFAEREATDLVGAIQAYAFAAKCDLIVMHRRDRPWFRELLTSSNTDDAVLRTRLPLLLLTTDDLLATDTKRSETMSIQGYFERFTQSGQLFIKEVARALGAPEDRRRALRITKAVLHALRDRLNPAESIQLVAQLPLYIKAIYVDGWKLSDGHAKVRSVRDFFDLVRRPGAGATDVDLPTEADVHTAVEAVFSVLRGRVSPGELDDIRACLPGAIAELV